MKFNKGLHWAQYDLTASKSTITTSCSSFTAIKVLL